MELIQIGQPPVLTLQQLIEQMAARQSAEIELLKQAALERLAAQHCFATKVRGSVRRARHQRLGLNPTPRALARR
jgi:hypothetical protein